MWVGESVDSTSEVVWNGSFGRFVCFDGQKGRVHVVSEPKCVVVKPFSYVSILYKTKL